jgi:high-affinity Fe2+/Pb2+ permease
VTDWKIAFGVVVGVLGLVVVGLVVWLVIMHRKSRKLPLISTLPLDSTPMSYD